MAPRTDLSFMTGHSLIEVLVSLCLISVMGLGLGLSALDSLRMSRSNRLQWQYFETQSLSCEKDSVRYAPFKVSVTETGKS